MVPVSKSEFKKLFERILQQAIESGERATGLHADRADIEFHGVGHSGKLVTPAEAIDLLYISENKFFSVIDVGVKAWERGAWRVFLRVSDHAPTSFEKTWNTPLGNGPFKLVEAYEVRIKK